MARSILVYDGSSRWFRLAAEAFSRCSDDIVTVPWESERVQSFLEAQFGGRPFAFILIEGESVHVGSETVETVLRRRGVAKSVSRLFKRVYPIAGPPFGRLVHDREPADLDGTFALDDDARAYIDPLRRYQTIPVESA
jgi:hypothetical protein